MTEILQKNKNFHVRNTSEIAENLTRHEIYGNLRGLLKFHVSRHIYLREHSLKYGGVGHGSSGAGVSRRGSRYWGSGS